MKNKESSWHPASSEFLRAVRGKRSQVAFARRLGYKSNPIVDWEAGRYFPTAANALRACQLTGVDVAGAFARFEQGSSGELQICDDKSIAAWLTAMRGKTTIIELSRRAGQPRHSISRWLAGRNRPRLPQFFALVDAMTGRASDLIAELVNVENVPAVREKLRRRELALSLAYDEPWTEAILRVLETEAYAKLPHHVPFWISDRLNIPPEVETRCIEKMVEARLIVRDANKFVSNPITVDTTHADADGLRNTKIHWAQVSTQRAQEVHEEDYFGYNVFSVSTEDLEVIREMLSQTYREIRSRVAASSPVEEVAMVQLRLLRW